jgi:hypothetical protein
MRLGRIMSHKKGGIAAYRWPERRSGDTASAGLWERRRQSRKPALWVGKLTTPTGTHECRVLNLSPKGARIEFNELVGIDDPVTLSLEFLGSFVGSVKWQWDQCIGIAIN